MNAGQDADLLTRERTVLLQSATNKRASDTRERALEEREQKLLRQTDDMERDVRTSLRGATAAAAAESDAKLKEEAFLRQKLVTENKRLQRARLRRVPHRFSIRTS